MAWTVSPIGDRVKTMVTEVEAGPYTVRGISVGGIYTSLHVPQLGALLDVGIPLRTAASAPQLFLSHAHADHVGALVTLQGIRGLSGAGMPRTFLPAPVAEDLRAALEATTRLQRHPLDIELVPMEAGREEQVRPDLWVRAFRTHHPVPSLGYQFFRKVEKLKAEYLGLPGERIRELKGRGVALFDEIERLELAYATDTLIRVLDTHPSLLTTRVLVLECSFLDERKPLAQSRAGCHIHLDELLERTGDLACEWLVLMHFSQIYKPREVHEILQARLPPDLWRRTLPFAPRSGHWFG